MTMPEKDQVRMNMQNREQQRAFSGKVMLFGEYSIMEGSGAALVPLRKLQGKLILPLKSDVITRQSNRKLIRFAQFLEEKTMHDIMDIEQLINDLENGLYFYSGIPENYGLGSSGAICAALYEAYHTSDGQLSLSDLRKIFAGMESFFHGSSSGADPLCIYLDQPLIINESGNINMVSDRLFEHNRIGPFLVNTSKESLTAPLVHQFRRNMKDLDYVNGFTGYYIPAVNRAIDEWVNGKLQETTVFELSRAQDVYLNAMIPEAFKRLWQEGMNSRLFALKICGSGGGGMVLGFTDRMAETREYFLTHHNLAIETI
jgi:mevalonate kinase